MVKLIINENGGNVDITKLSNEIKENKELLEEIKNNLQDNNTDIDISIFEDTVNESFKSINQSLKLLSEDIEKNHEDFLAFKKYVELKLGLISNRISGTDNDDSKKTALKETVKSKPTNTIETLSKKNSVSITKPKKKGRKVRDNDVYEPTVNSKTDWSKLKLLKDGSIINDLPKKFKLPVGLNELLYIMELDNPHMKRGIAKKLMNIYSINNITFGKLIHNIRETNNFDGVIDEYHRRLFDAKFRIKNGVIYVNNTNTGVSVSTASEWVQILANTDKKQGKILEIQRQYSNLNKDMIRIICDSYNNPKLNTLLSFDNSSKKSTFIENNPSKRRNLIRNGGMQ